MECFGNILFFSKCGWAQAQSTCGMWKSPFLRNFEATWCLVIFTWEDRFMHSSRRNFANHVLLVLMDRRCSFNVVGIMTNWNFKSTNLLTIITLLQKNVWSSSNESDPSIRKWHTYAVNKEISPLKQQLVHSIWI